LFSSIRSFENKDSTELAPGGIMDAFGEMMILRQIGDLQAFVVDRIVLFKKRKGCFMVKIPALPGNLLVSTLQKPNGLAASLAALLAPRYPSLCFHEAFFCLPVVARVSNLLAIGSCEE
jgi:hypothetical protein